jgi:hypothetical protein
MEVLEGQKHASYEESRLLLAELLVLGQMISEITSLHEIYDEEQIFTIVERVVHVDQEAKNNLNGSV